MCKRLLLACGTEQNKKTEEERKALTGRKGDFVELSINHG
jgi:hypothetical protein